MKKRILAAAIGLAVSTLWADETETIGDYTWTFTTNDVEAVITGVTPQPTGDLILPSALAEKTVTGIGERVFADCYGLTSGPSISWAMPLPSAPTSHDGRRRLLDAGAGRQLAERSHTTIRKRGLGRTSRAGALFRSGGRCRPKAATRSPSSSAR